MTPEEWSKVERIFHDALERPTTERPVFLDGACGGDSALRQHVESLIQHAGRTEMPLAPQFRQEVSAALSAATDGSLVGRTLGSYEVKGLLGCGGMGEVYRARDSKLKRDVAIKALPADFVRDPERVARFQREAEVLASLRG
jgi:serine/threonine protein kinase